MTQDFHTGINKGGGFSMAMDKQSLSELSKLFKTLPDNIGRNALRAAIKTSANRTKEHAQNILLRIGAVDTGRLAMAVQSKIKSQRYGNNFYKATVGVATGKKRNDPTGAYYAGFVEFGHAIVGRNFSVHGSVPARPFLVPGLEETTPKNISDFASNVKKEIDKRVARMSKQKRASYGV